MEANIEELTQRFGVADYIVFVGMLVVSTGIGIYYACSGDKQKTTKEFLMGNRSMSVFPVALSVLASFMSAITLLGTPAEMYQYGTQYWMIIFAYILVIPGAAYLYLPVFYNLKLTSAYEYLELRYSKKIRSLGSAVFAVQMILYMAIVLYAPSLALSQVTGIHVWGSVLSIGIVCTFYTTVGGIKAVIWTDVFQVLLMFCAMFVVVIKGMVDMDGIRSVWQRNVEGGRIEFLNFDPHPTTRHTIWSLIIGGYFTWLAVYGVNQSMVQRYLSIPTLKGARMAIWINLPGLGLLLTITCLAGLIIYTRYAECDPITVQQVRAPDQLFPLFVMDTLGMFPGLPGLFVSGIFSGALSTVSSGVNSLAAVTLEDFIKNYMVPDLSEERATLVTKILALLFGVICIALVAVAERLGNVLQAALSIFGIVGGPLLGLFTLGIFFPWSNTKGAMVGLLSSLAISFWTGLGAFIYKPYNPKASFSIEGCSEAILNNTIAANQTLIIASDMPNDSEDYLSIYKLSYMWFSAFGCILVVVIGLIVSLLTGSTEPHLVDKRLISPLVWWFFSYLPVKAQKFFGIYRVLNENASPEDEKVEIKKLQSIEIIGMNHTKVVTYNANEDKGKINLGFAGEDQAKTSDVIIKDKELSSETRTLNHS